MNYSTTKYTARLSHEDLVAFLQCLNQLEAAKVVKVVSTSKDGKSHSVTVIPTMAGEDVVAASFEKGQLKREGWGERFSMQKLCPFNGIAYEKIPGYETGFGCPVCKRLGVGHLTLHGAKEIREAIAKTEKLKEKTGAK